MTSPTQLTLRHLRQAGYTACVVERWLKIPKHPAGGVHKDAFGLDVMAIRADKPGVLGCQVTSASNLSSRVAKVLANTDCLTWLRAGNRIWCLGFRKRMRNGRKVWEPIKREVTVVDFVEVKV